MPYNKFKRQGKYCIGNKKTRRTTCFKSDSDRSKGIRIREAFSHGWKPTGKVKVRRHMRKGRPVKGHKRKVSPKCKGKRLNEPWKSNRKYKKRQVCTKNKQGDIVNVHYGDNRYEDYTQHKDKARRRNFRTRHNCDPVKKLDKGKPRYWACQDLW